MSVDEKWLCVARGWAEELWSAEAPRPASSKLPYSRFSSLAHSMDPERLDTTSRWVSEDALAVVGGTLSEDERVNEFTDSEEDLEDPCSSGNETRTTTRTRSTMRTSSGPRGSSWRHFLQHVGPGFLMCIAYVDPGNLEADLQTGVGTGYKLLWVLLYSTVLGGVLQSLAAKLGVATSRHLAQHCRDMYGPGPMRILLWLMAELAIIGSDIQEVIGTSLAVLLLTGGAIKLYQGVLVGAVGAYVLLFLEKFGLRWLEAFFQVLVGVLAVCMTALFFVAKVPCGRVLEGLAVPRLDAASVSTATGLLGALLMPHNVYLHSALVHERGVPARSTAKRSLFFYKVEAGIALVVTLVINVAVIGVFAHGFGEGGEREDPPEIGLYNAGTFLSARFGAAMGMVWALGLLAAGVSSTMTGTYAGQFVMSGFLNLKMGALQRGLVTRAVALVPTVAVALMFDEDGSGTATSLDRMNQWLNILQSVQLPFAIIPLLFLTANPAVVGLGFVNSRLTNVLSGTTATAVIAINIIVAVQTVTTGLEGAALGWRMASWAVMAGYLGVLAYLVLLSIRSLDVNVVGGVEGDEWGERGERERLLDDDEDGENDGDDGDDEDDAVDGNHEKVETAGNFTYVPIPPIPLGATMEEAYEPAQSVASSRAASLVLSSRTGTRSHAVVAVADLDD